ncbi:MAG: PAS domain-containing protein [Tenuifilaceae bacterium]|jgi:transcriptional regulator with PAS, ATPase and Fis domain|nr:PAS domain-containing protein [Tenuifilaceae bacterium]
MNNLPEWATSLNCAITVCNLNGDIIYMNQKAQRTFEKWGGKELVGKNLFQCHNQRSIEIIRRLMIKNESNAYTIEKNGVKKLIYQTPWHQEGEVAGLVELSIELPLELPHFVR